MTTVEATVTIRPLSRSSIPPSTARVHRNAPVALTSIWVRQSSSAVRASGALLETQARISIGSLGVAPATAWCSISGNLDAVPA